MADSGNPRHRHLPPSANRNVWLAGAVGLAIIVAVVAWAYSGDPAKPPERAATPAGPEQTTGTDPGETPKQPTGRP